MSGEFQRPQVSTIVQRLSEPPDRLVAVFGPRQTGKTTAARQALAIVERGRRYEAVDDPGTRAAHGPSETGVGYSVRISDRRDRQWLRDVWEESRHQAWRSGRGFVLVLDEIQKIDGWSETVKGLWDADRAAGCPLHVVILGSSPLLMQRGLNETLAGRFEPIRFTHWSYAEMSEAFGLGLERYVFFGGYPGAAPRIGDSGRWAGYVRGALIEPNIERDVLSMTRVDKPALLKRLFYLGASYSGQVVSYTKLVGQLQDAGNTTTLTRYLDLLSQAGLL
ncbi:MAG: AAA family ATPase, partial [bacterium]|nr:AAA family ATPase [bacterium]